MPRHAVQIPGEPPAEPTTEKPELQAVAVQTGMEDMAEPTELDRLRAMVDAQSAQIANLMGAVQNMARSAHGNGEKPSQSDGGLPDAASVDLGTIAAPVLTKQGWIVPPDYGMPPEAKAERVRQQQIDKILLDKAVKA